MDDITIPVFPDHQERRTLIARLEALDHGYLLDEEPPAPIKLEKAQALLDGASVLLFLVMITFLGWLLICFLTPLAGS